MQSMKNKQITGFTLLEVMIAISLLAMIFFMLYGTLTSTQKLAHSMEGESDVYRQAQIALSRMSSELSMVYWPPQRDASSSRFIGVDGTRFDEDQESWPSDSLFFIALSHARLAKDAPEGELAHVTYLLDHGLLLRQEELAGGGLFREIPLAEEVLGLNFRFFDGGKKQWVKEWDSKKRNRPPKGVEIQLILRDASGNGRPFVTATDLPMG